MANAVVDERSKSPNAIIGAENAYQGRGLVFGLLLWCVIAAAAFVLVGPTAVLTTVLPKQSGSADFFFPSDWRGQTEDDDYTDISAKGIFHIRRHLG